MSKPTCMNCGAAVCADDMLITHKKKIIGAVCPACLEDVRKPRVTFTRTTKSGAFEAEQYSAVEVFR